MSENLSEKYWKYKGFYNLKSKGLFIDFKTWLRQYFNILDYEMRRNRLIWVEIQFATSTFDRVTKDKAAKFVDMLSAVGGTMGLLTGFSIISGVEIVYFAIIIVINFFKKPN